MKIKLAYFSLVVFFLKFNFSCKYEEQFNFDVTEIEISDNGNKFTGKNGGNVSTNNGVEIKANEFEYNKELNLLSASGEVEVHDQINNYKIYSENVFYDKNKEIITTKEKSKALSLNDEIIITAKNI